MSESLLVGLTFNLKQNIRPALGAPDDALAEYDSLETIMAMEEVLTAAGHRVVRLEADESLLDSLRQHAPDICFNIAEGLRGEAREAQVPALLEMLGIPYTGSKVLGHAISLDKAATKRIWRDCGLPTPPFQVFGTGAERVDPQLRFPLFVKPLSEGTGMGINQGSTVGDEIELRSQARWVIQTYKQPALAEGYLPGREFTVGVIGNRPSPGAKHRNGRYNAHGYHVFPILEIDAEVGAGMGAYNAASKAFRPGEQGAPEYSCPADVPLRLERQLRSLAVRAFEGIGALDLGRVDFRLGADGRPYLIEINTLPGLNPLASDLCIMARAEGMSYFELINEILGLAWERHTLQSRRGALRLHSPRLRARAIDAGLAPIWAHATSRGGS
jgi:D-alanine-D-alanine ligase